MAELAVKFAREDFSYCYTGMRDALHNLGITADRNTVERILNDNGIKSGKKTTRLWTGSMQKER